jgi:hypothetical protein
MPSTTIQIGAQGLPILTFIKGATYWVFLWNAIGGTFDAWSSPDAATWGLAATGPRSPGWGFGSGGYNLQDGGAAFFDGDHTVTLAYQSLSYDSLYYFGDNFLIDFDLNAGTWGAPYADQTFSGFTGHSVAPAFIFRLSSGNIAVIYQDTRTYQVPFGYKPAPFMIQAWDGSSWTALVDICAGAEALPDFAPLTAKFQFCTAVLDSADVVHAIYWASDASVPDWNNPRFFYQEILPDGTLQNFQEFPGQTGAQPDLQVLYQTPGPNLYILGGKLFWGIWRYDYVNSISYVSVYIGSPIINPVWTELGNLDPTAVDGDAEAAPIFVVDPISGQFYMSFLSNDTGVTAAVTTDGFATFSNLDISDTVAGTPQVNFFAPFLLFGPLYAITGGIISEGGTIPVSITSFSGPAPVVPSIKITFRGVKRTRCAPEGPEYANMPTAPSVKRAM